MVLTSLTSETCPVTWRVWGLVRRPHHWVSLYYLLLSIWIAFVWVKCKHFSYSPWLALASSLEGSPSCWTTSCVHVYALQWGSGLWRILTRTRSVANVEQVVYILSFLLKSRDFKEGLKKLHYFFNWTFTILWPLSCFGCI